MTEFVSDILNYLQNNENAQGVVVALAAFGVPLFSFLLYLLFRILRIKVGAMASRALAALVTGYTFFGFITQIILLSFTADGSANILTGVQNDCAGA